MARMETGNWGAYGLAMSCAFAIRTVSSETLITFSVPYRKKCRPGTVHTTGSRLPNCCFHAARTSPAGIRRVAAEKSACASHRFRR